MPTNKGGFKIFTLAGITVYIHWSWFLVAIYSVQFRTNTYTSMVWNVAEYLSLFLIVLIHEFGHQLACRSVGGKTHDIVLWPLGGVAYVSLACRSVGGDTPKLRAGPLVNALLIPVLAGLWSFSFHQGWNDTHHDAYELCRSIWVINLTLLIFNMMPVYPLDGGQILRSLLWFVFGRANSLLAASIIGFIGVAGLILLAIFLQSIWLGIMAAFMLMSCWSGLRQALALAKIAKLPRRPGFACPSCKTAPPLGNLWRCGKCGQAFDTFTTQGVCPHCGTQFSITQCLDCGTSRPIGEWIVSLPL
jgi:Zn-dependent protease